MSDITILDLFPVSESNLKRFPALCYLSPEGMVTNSSPHPKEWCIKFRATPCLITTDPENRLCCSCRSLANNAQCFNIEHWWWSFSINVLFHASHGTLKLAIITAISDNHCNITPLHYGQIG